MSILSDDIKKNLNLYLKGYEIEMIGNNAIERVKLENHEKGIPLVYSVDGMIYYELADGTVTKKSPFENENNDRHNKEAGSVQGK